MNKTKGTVRIRLLFEQYRIKLVLNRLKSASLTTGNFIQLVLKKLKSKIEICGGEIGTHSYGLFEISNGIELLLPESSYLTKMKSFGKSELVIRRKHNFELDDVRSRRDLNFNELEIKKCYRKLAEHVNAALNEKIVGNDEPCHLGEEDDEDEGSESGGINNKERASVNVNEKLVKRKCVMIRGDVVRRRVVTRSSSTSCCSNQLIQILYVKKEVEYLVETRIRRKLRSADAMSLLSSCEARTIERTLEKCLFMEKKKIVTFWN
jgi:hypothetical protein